MGHRQRARPTTRDIRARVLRRLDDALAALVELGAADTDGTDATHTVRTRCKEARALVRLLAPPGDRAGRRVDRWIHDAGDALGSLRDEHVLATTLASLPAPVAAPVAAGAPTGRPDQVAVARAVELLMAARDDIGGWRVGRRRRPIARGLEAAYRAARRRFRAALDDPSDEAMHAWRRAVKRLTYQVRAVRHWAPSILRPYAARLDDVGSLLGDDHDLTVAVARLRDAADVARDDPAATATIEAAIAAAVARQAAIRDRAIRLGASLLAERPTAFCRRLDALAAARIEVGRERRPRPDC